MKEALFSIISTGLIFKKKFKFVKMQDDGALNSVICSKIVESKLLQKYYFQGEKMDKKMRTDSRGKRIGMFVLKTVVYFAILMALIYLYEYSGLNSVHFIYNEF